MSVTYVSHFADTGDPGITEQLIDCYRDVFADSPWNEWLKCAVCEKYWGRKDTELIKEMTFQHCGQKLEDFWPRELVRFDIFNEMRKGSSACWLALEERKVIGFCWGYPTNCLDFDKKMGLKVDYSSLGLIGSVDEKLALQDEVGVLAPYRGKKIAKELVRLRNLDFLSMGLNHGVVRTRERPDPSITYLWYLKLGYKILVRYPQHDGRVIMGVNLAHIT